MVGVGSHLVRQACLLGGLLLGAATSACSLVGSLDEYQQGQGAAPCVRPDEGEYLYDASGSMSLTVFTGSGGGPGNGCLEGGGLPLADQAFDETMSAVVAHRDSCCWDIEMTMNEYRWDRFSFCYRADASVVKTGLFQEQTWDLGGVPQTTETSFNCQLGDMLYEGMVPPQSWDHFCSGFTSANAQEPYYYTARFTVQKIDDRVQVGGTERPAYRLHELTTYAVASQGEQDATHWIDPANGFPLQNLRQIELITVVPDIGFLQYTETGEWTLRSP